MAKGNKKNTEVIDEIVVEKQVVETSEINEKQVVEIILLSSSKQVKEDTVKKVSGNVANVLINKGFAKLKN